MVQTGSPSTHVDVTRAAPTSSAGCANGSRSSTTRSATAPGSSTPAPSWRSRWLAHALPEVYAAKATCERQRLLRQERVRAGPPRVVVRRAGDRGVDRGQRVGRGHRPVAAGHQPGAGAVQVAEGVLPAAPLLAQEREGEVGHLVVVAGPERLHVRGDAELGEPRDVGRVHQLQVGDVVPPRGIGADHRVQRLPHAAVADRVDVHLEPGRVEGLHGLAQPLGVDERVAAVVGRMAAAVEVRLEQRRGPVLGDAVLHDLHGRGAEPAAGERLPSAHQVRHLLDALPPVPPQGPHDVGPERAGPGRVDVGRSWVVHRRVGAHDRVLPARHAERVQVGLAGEEGRPVLLTRGPWQVPGDQ